MDLPIFCTVDARPVKVVSDGDGGVEVFAFDKAKGDFVRRNDLLERVLMQDDYVVELTEEEFQAHLASYAAGSSSYHQKVG